MLKRFLAASAIATGIVGLLAGGNAFADLPEINSGSYAPGQTIYAVATNSKICINKKGGYDGDLIIADIWGTNFRKQITFDSFSGDESCKLVGGAPSDGRMRFVTPMGLSNMSFFTQVEDGYVDGEIYLNLNNATTSNKYLRSYGWGVVRTESQRPESTVLVTGQEFNRRLKRLVGNSNVEFYDNDSDITSIEFVDRLPDSINRDTTPKVNIAISGNEPVYAYQDENGHVYINTLAKKIRTNGFCSQMFLLMWSLESLVLPDTLDTSGTTDMTSMFSGIGVESLSLPETFDTSSATNMDRMFYGMPRATSISLPETFNTSNVTNMSQMFAQSYNLSSLSLPNAFNTSKVTDMDKMFYATGITSLVLPASFKTSNVTNMRSMFMDMAKLTTLTLPESFDTSKVTDMGNMFYRMGALTNLYLPDQFMIGQNADVGEIFGRISSTAALGAKDKTARALWPGYLSCAESSAELDDGADVSAKIKKMAHSDETENIKYSYADDRIKAIKMASDLPAGFDRTNSDNIVSSVDSLEQIYAWYDNTNNGGVIYVYTDAAEVRGGSSVHYLFYKLGSLADIADIASWNMSNVTNMGGLFGYDTSLTNISAISGWDVSNVTNMGNLFGYASALTDVSALSNWDTASLEVMSGTFCAMPQLTDISGIADWDTSKVWNLSGTFSGDTSLANISALSGWNTSSLTLMTMTFYNSAITNVMALSSWNVSSVTQMTSTFAEDKALVDISGLSGWDVASVTGFHSMFNGATSLSNLQPISGWAVSSSAGMSNMFYNTAATQLPSWYHE